MHIFTNGLDLEKLRPSLDQPTNIPSDGGDIVQKNIQFYNVSNSKMSQEKSKKIALS